jgi:hypothetical protein
MANYKLQGLTPMPPMPPMPNIHGQLQIARPDPDAA